MSIDTVLGGRRVNQHRRVAPLLTATAVLVLTALTGGPARAATTSPPPVNFAKPHVYPAAAATPRLDVGLCGACPSGLATADFNHDGVPDLAVADRASGVAIELGRRDGTFAAPVNYPIAFPAGKNYPGTTAVSAGDLNGDGTPDLAAVNLVSGNVSILLGRGDGTFAPARDYPLGRYSFPNGVAIGDVTGDGIPDVVVADATAPSGSTTVWVLAGVGDGTFAPAVGYKTDSCSADTVTIGDFNRDGHLDVAYGGFFQKDVPPGPERGNNYGCVGIMLGTSSGTLAHPVSTPVPADPTASDNNVGPTDIVARDLNGDGILDLLTGNRSAGSGTKAVSVLIGAGDGTFAKPVSYPADPYESGTDRAVAVADINGDGHLDVVTTNRIDATVSVLLGDGTGALGAPATFVMGAYDPMGVVLADFNGDGAIDIATANPANADGFLGSISVLLNTKGVLDWCTTAPPPGDGAVSGTWTTTTLPPNDAHYVPTASLLPTGQALVVGGAQGADQGQLFSAELYDPASQRWTPAAPLPVHSNRYLHTATSLSDGRVLVAGGEEFSTGKSLSSTEIYDPASGHWTQTSNMNAARENFAAGRLADGRVLVSGGYAEPRSSEVYDPATNVWTRTGDMVGTHSFGTHDISALPNGKALIVGDFSIYHGGSYRAELFDPASGTWSATDRMWQSREVMTSTVLRDGRVLVVGGSTHNRALDSAELYDPKTETWCQTGSLHQARYAAATTLLPNGDVLVEGGTDGTTDLNSAELYDPTTGQWTMAPPMNTARFHHAATVLANGDVLVVGSLWTDGAQTAEVFHMDAGPTPAPVVPEAPQAVLLVVVGLMTLRGVQARRRRKAQGQGQGHAHG